MAASGIHPSILYNYPSPNSDAGQRAVLKTKQLKLPKRENQMQSAAKSELIFMFLIYLVFIFYDCKPLRVTLR